MGSGEKIAVVDSLEMFADIADDILIEVIDEYCCHSFKIQRNKFEREIHHHPKTFVGEIPNLRDERNSVSNEIPGANAMYKGQSSCQNHGSNQFRLFGVVMTPQIEQSSADSNDVSEGYQFVSGTSDNLSKREKNADATKNLVAFAANSNEREKRFSTNGVFEDGTDLNVHLEGKSSKDISDRESKKPRTGVQKLRTISCILLEPNLPELWIQNCARCLTFIRKVDRFFIGRSSPGNYRWAFLSTATEDDLLECEGACGIIMLGSEIDCPAARLYNMVHDRSIRKSQAFVPYSYMLFNVAYDETKMQECLSCARSNIIPFVDRNNEREKYFIGLTSGTNDLSDFKEKCLLKDICKRLSGELHKEFNIFDWKTVGSSKNEAKESHQINIGKKWTPSFPCMHLTAPLNGGRDTYRYPIDVEKKESRDRAIIPDCLACMLATFYSFERVPSSKLFTHSIQPTSLTSSLVFFTQELHVQEAAIKCTEKCAWVSGLSESMCSYLKRMTPKVRVPEINPVGTRSTSSIPSNQKNMGSVLSRTNHPTSHDDLMSASTHYFIPPSDQTCKMRTLQQAIEHLSNNDVSKDVAWLLHFERGNSETFRDLAFCIAAVSNAYVVSSVSSYILTSRFKYPHLEAFCNLRGEIKVIFYKSMKMGLLPQPLNFASVLISLAVTDISRLKHLIRIKRSREKQIRVKKAAERGRVGALGCSATGHRSKGFL